MSVSIYDQNLGAPWSICLRFWLGNSVVPQEFSQPAWFYNSKLSGSAFTGKTPGEVGFPNKLVQYKVKTQRTSQCE